MTHTSTTQLCREGFIIDCAGILYPLLDTDIKEITLQIPLLPQTFNDFNRHVLLLNGITQPFPHYPADTEALIDEAQL